MKIKIILSLMIVALFMHVGARVCRADTYLLDNSIDSKLKNWSPNSGSGTELNMEIYRNSSTNGTSRIIFGFTLPLLDGTIEEMNLFLYNSGINENHTIDIHESTKDFTESATWNTYDGSNNWTSAGGDYNATVVDSLNITTADKNNWVEFGLIGTNADNEIIKNWGDDVYLILKHSTEGEVYQYSTFWSKEYNDDTKRPYIEIIYSPEVVEPVPYMTYPDDISIIHRFTTEYNASGTITGYKVSDEYHPFNQFLFWAIVQGFIAFVLIYLHIIYEKKKKKRR